MSPHTPRPTAPRTPAPPHSPPSSWWPPSLTGPRGAGEDHPGVRHHPRSLSSPAEPNSPLKHSPVSTLLLSMSLNYEFPGQGLRKQNYDLETLGIFQLKGQTGSFPLGRHKYQTRPIVGPEIPATASRGSAGYHPAVWTARLKMFFHLFNNLVRS